MHDLTSVTTPARPRPAEFYTPAVRRVLRAVFAVAGIAPSAGAALAHRLFYVPRKPKPAMLRMPEARRMEMQVEGLRVAAWRAGGQGRPVLLIHGWESSTARMQPLMDALVSRGVPVIAFDQPAHGCSDGRQTDIRQICAIANLLVRDHGPLRALVGHSYGGLCAANLLRSVPVQSVVLFATPSSYQSMIDRYVGLIGLRGKCLEAFTASIHRRYAPERFDQHFDAVRNLASSSVPALILHDVDDGIVPFADAQALSQAHPHAQLVALHGLGHNRMLRDPAVVARCADFIASHQGDV
jgi:pimeloyl-ACP methyl ester carboxylesterase